MEEIFRDHRVQVSYITCVRAQSLQPVPTLRHYGLFCDRLDYNPPGFSVHGILQARIWNGLPCPPPGDLPNPGTESESSAAPEVQVDSLPLSNCPYVGGPHPIC